MEGEIGDIDEVEREELKKYVKKKRYVTISISKKTKALFRDYQKQHEASEDALLRLIRRARYCYENHSENKGFLTNNG